MSSPLHDTFYLVVAIDYGTTHLSVAYQLVRHGRKPDPNQTRVLRLDGERQYLQQAIALIQEPSGSVKFFYAREALQRYKHSANHLEFILIERPKTFLFPSGEGKDWIDRIEDEMANKLDDDNIDMFNALSGHFSYLKDAIKRAVMKAEGMTDSEYDGLAMHAVCTVPESSAIGRRHLLQQIIENAGFERAVLMSETEAAGAYHCHQILLDDQSQRRSRDVQCMAVVDAGGWTLNGACYKHSEGGAHATFRLVGQPISKELGGETLTCKYFLPYARDRIIEASIDAQGPASPTDAFRSRADRLGMSASHLERELSESFDVSVKQKIEDVFDFQKTHRVVIDSRAGEIDHLMVEIPGVLLEEWFQRLSGDICAMISDLGRCRPQVVLCTGGFFHNEYIRSTIASHCETLSMIPRFQISDPRGEPVEAVAKGACTRFEILRPTPQPLDFSIGCLMWEPYDRRRHGNNAVTIPEELHGKENWRKNDRWAVLRWMTLIKKGEVPTSPFPWIHETCDISREQPVCWRQLYCTYRDMADGDAAYKQPPRGLRINSHEELGLALEQGQLELLDEIQLWGREVELRLDESALQGYNIFDKRISPRYRTLRYNGEDEYREVTVTTTVEVDEHHQFLVYTLQPPGWHEDPRLSKAIDCARELYRTKVQHGFFHLELQRREGAACREDSVRSGSDHDHDVLPDSSSTISVQRGQSRTPDLDVGVVPPGIAPPDNPAHRPGRAVSETLSYTSAPDTWNLSEQAVNVMLHNVMDLGGRHVAEQRAQARDQVTQASSDSTNAAHLHARRVRATVHNRTAFTAINTMDIEAAARQHVYALVEDWNNSVDEQELAEDIERSTQILSDPMELSE